MTSKNKFYLFGLGIIIILLVILGAAKDLYWPSQKVVNNDQPEVIAPSTKTATPTKEVLTNAKGQKWILPATADFTVSTASGSPINFLEGKIEPLKVHPGDTQNMRLVIMSASGLSGVRAEIETDHGTTTVELKKTGTLAVKDLDLRLATYIIDAQNKLQMLSPAEAATYRQKEIAAEASSSSGINSALAATGGREVWEGSWLVKDTSVRTYHTVFTATDTVGNKDSLVLAWSDPCGWPVGTNVTASANCPISSPVGVDNGNLTISNNVNITLSDNLYFNPTKNISITTAANPLNLGKITMNGGSFSKAYVYYLDKDQDGYASDSGGGLPSVVVSTTDAGNLTTGYAAVGPSATYARRGYKMTHDPYAVVDCDDNNASIYQLYTGYTDADNDGYRLSTYTTNSNICGGASFPTGQGWTQSTTADCYDSNANVKPSQVNWWSSTGTGWTPAGDYNCSGVAQYAWAQNLSYTNYTPAQTTESQSAAWTIACSQYTGTQYTASACGTTIGYTGSIFVIASGAFNNSCDTARANSELRYWTAGPIISVCK